VSSLHNMLPPQVGTDIISLLRRTEQMVQRRLSLEIQQYNAYDFRVRLL